MCVAAAQATILITDVPAIAGYGAIVYDSEKHKQGVAWIADTQQRADEAVLRASDTYKVRFGVPPGRCAALARWSGCLKVGQVAQTRQRHP